MISKHVDSIGLLQTPCGGDEQTETGLLNTEDEEALKPSDSWTLRVIWRHAKTIYLQFWWDPRVALLSFGAMLPALPSWPQITFVSFLSFGPFVASGSVIAIVSMVSLNNQTSSHEKDQSLILTIYFYTNAAPFFKNAQT